MTEFQTPDDHTQEATSQPGIAFAELAAGPVQVSPRSHLMWLLPASVALQGHSGSSIA